MQGIGYRLVFLLCSPSLYYFFRSDACKKRFELYRDFPGMGYGPAGRYHCIDGRIIPMKLIPYSVDNHAITYVLYGPMDKSTW